RVCERLYVRLAFRGERGGDKRHAGTKIARIEKAPTQLRRPADNDSMRVAEEEAGAHRAQLLKGEESQLVQPVVDQRAAIGLSRQDGDEADHVAWKPGPQSRRDSPQRGQRRGFDEEPVVVESTVQAHPAE